MRLIRRSGRDGGGGGGAGAPGLGALLGTPGSRDDSGSHDAFVFAPSDDVSSCSSSLGDTASYPSVASADLSAKDGRGGAAAAAAARPQQHVSAVMQREGQYLRGGLSSNLDEMRIVDAVMTLQQTAMTHLENDEFEDTLISLEYILSTYEETLSSMEEKNKSEYRVINPQCPELLVRRHIGTVLHNMGIVRLLNGEYGLAMVDFHRAMETRKECLGENHTDHLASLVKFGTACYACGKASLSEKSLREALGSKPRLGGIGDELESEIRNNLGCIQFESGLHGDALKSFQASLELQSRASSESLYSGRIGLESCSNVVNARSTAIRCNIGYIHLKTNEPDAAIHAFENCLTQQQLLMRPSDPIALLTLDSLAEAHLQKKERHKALKVYNRMLQIQIDLWGAHDVRVAQTMSKISLVEVQNRNYERALEYVQHVNEAGTQNKDPKLARKFRTLMSIGRYASKRVYRSKEATVARTGRRTQTHKSSGTNDE